MFNIVKDKIWCNEVKKRHNALKTSNYKHMQPTDMLDILLADFKDIRKNISVADYEELVEEVRDIEYNKSEVENDGYPTDLEFQIYQLLK